MKIAHVVSTFWPHFGGMGSVCQEEATRLVALGHEVTVFTLRYPKFVYPPTNDFAFKIERLPTWLKWGDAGIIPALTKKLKDFDVVHLHYPFYGGAEWVWQAKQRYNKKCVITYHMDAQPTGWGKKLVQFFYGVLFAKQILNAADKVIVFSKDFLRQTKFGLKILPSKLVVLPNGVDTKLFVPSDVVLTEKTLLFVGNLLLVKRLDLLLRALVGLPNEVKLKVVGGGYAEKELQALTKELKIEERVDFVGPISDQKQLVKFCQSAWALVVPSDYESFSLAAVYAMACGCPVVGSDVPGLADKIFNGKNGFLFTPGSVSDLQEKLNKVLTLSLSERTQMGIEARQLMVEKYDWDKHVAELEKIYQSL